MTTNAITPIGRVDFRDDRRVFGIRRDDRRYHMLLIGRSGTGKSTLLLNLIRSDMENGEGVAIVDPHGDLAAEASRAVPHWRASKIVHFDPADPNNDITFNPLHVDDQHQRHLIVSELIAVFQQIWGRAWGSRLEHILRVVLLTLTERPGYTLLDALRMLNDSQFRAEVVERIEDQVLKRFWLEEFSKYTTTYRTEAIAPIQTKLGEFLVNPVLRRVLDTPEGRIKPREIMDGGGIFIANLSVGRLGRDVAMLLGAVLVGKFALAALNRADQAPENRRDFYFYIDEFSLFATSSVDTMLSEARKYRLNVIAAIQYFEQLKSRIVASILGNIGNLIIFRVGAKDAAILERELTPVFNRDDLVNLPYYHAYVRMMIDHRPARPFSARFIEGS